MYDYRGMTPEQQRAIVEQRKERGFPWHRPPTVETGRQYRLITATCYEHRKHLNTAARLAWFERQLLDLINALDLPCAGWCVLPNHEHTFVRTREVALLKKELGKLHGRTSFHMNREDNARGRQVWYRCQDRYMRSLAHFYTTLNYIHNNPVKHGYVEKWQEWPFSSCHWYLETKGRDWLLKLWQDYPLMGYGDKWDP